MNGGAIGSRSFYEACVLVCVCVCVYECVLPHGGNWAKIIGVCSVHPSVCDAEGTGPGSFPSAPLLPLLLLFLCVGESPAQGVV